MALKRWIVGSVLVLSAVTVGRGQAQQSGKQTIFIAPNIARTLTISRSGAVVTTLAIPQGTIISVIFDTAENNQPSNNGRFLFHGNVEIHALAANQRTARLEEAMRQAPIQLTATGVDVGIAPQ